MKKTRDAHIADDAELFRASVAGVTRLPRSGKVERPAARPRPVPLQRLRDEQEVLRESLSTEFPWDAGYDTGNELSYARNGIATHVLRKLRRGHWVIQDELDLHGMTVEEARQLVGRFLAGCLKRGLRCVRIVHGKGLRSKNGEPVLKRNVAGWLMQRDEILAFCQARRADGGSGAVVVLLRG